MENLKIKLPNGHFLVAELCEYGAEIPPEIAVCIQDEEGVALQDIVLVRAKEKAIGVVDDVNVGAEVLVWADETNEDYTNKFLIEEHKFEEEEKQNKWEQLFEGFLDLTEFSLIKNKNPRLVLRYKDPDGNPVEEVHEGLWSIYDRQGANLGDIESDRFDNAKQIFERMGIYINDYIYRDLEKEIEAYEVDLEERELPWSAETWLALRNDQEFCKKYNKFFDDHKFEFDILDMICNHYEEIDLNNVYHEEEE